MKTDLDEEEEGEASTHNIFNPEVSTVLCLCRGSKPYVSPGRMLDCCWVI